MSGAHTDARIQFYSSSATEQPTISKRVDTRSQLSRAIRVKVREEAHKTVANERVRFAVRMSGKAAGDGAGGTEKQRAGASDAHSAASSSRKRQHTHGLGAFFCLNIIREYFCLICLCVCLDNAREPPTANALSNETRSRKCARTPASVAAAGSSSRSAHESAAATTSTGGGAGSRRRNELNFLTDHFPDQGANVGRLTRSRTRRQNSSATAGSSATAAAIHSGGGASEQNAHRAAKAHGAAAGTSSAALQPRSPTPDPSS